MPIYVFKTHHFKIAICNNYSNYIYDYSQLKSKLTKSIEYIMLFNFIALGYLNSDQGGFWIETDLIIYQVAISMFLAQVADALNSSL